MLDAFVAWAIFNPELAFFGGLGVGLLVAIIIYVGGKGPGSNV
jgi:hypothetical protein